MLRSIKTITDPKRNSSVDFFRGIAIIAVVFYHFDNKILPFGYLGVDLFFVISGLLIGGILTSYLKNGQPINFFKFILQRGFKIWPSYYVFLILGNLIAYCIYRHSDANQIIPLWDIKRYVFFYQNYTGLPFHWSFDHVWSLCVEEHFYIMLPILFILIQKNKNGIYKKNILLISILLTILLGITFKFCSFYLTHSKDTYSGTHNRIDALAWGVLLNYILTYYKPIIQGSKNKFVYLLSGISLFSISVFYSTYNSVFFNKIVFHSIVPASFFLMLMGTYFMDFSKFKPLRFIAYYSYNWYLWHPLFVIFVNAKFGTGISGLMVYLLITFLMACIATILIEEPFLNARKLIINKIFIHRRTKDEEDGITATSLKE